MDISNGMNIPINMYGSATGNNINLAVESENKIYGANIFSNEYAIKETKKNISAPVKKKKRNRRLNTIDSDFLPYETEEIKTEEAPLNFFIEKKQNPALQKLKKIYEYLLTTIPLVNYFYLRHKEQKIENTVKQLNDIIQNADELMNTAVPFGENNKIYQNIAQNLNKAAIVIGKVNKEL